MAPRTTAPPFPLPFILSTACNSLLFVVYQDDQGFRQGGVSSPVVNCYLNAFIVAPGYFSVHLSESQI